VFSLKVFDRTDTHLRLWVEVSIVRRSNFSRAPAPLKDELHLLVRVLTWQWHTRSISFPDATNTSNGDLANGVEPGVVPLSDFLPFHPLCNAVVLRFLTGVQNELDLVPRPSAGGFVWQRLARSIPIPDVVDTTSSNLNIEPSLIRRCDLIN